MLILAGMAWLMCGFVHYGLFVGYFQRQFAEIADETLRGDRIFAALFIAAGPFALVPTLITCTPYSWKL